MLLVALVIFALAVSGYVVFSETSRDLDARIANVLASVPQDEEEA